MNRAFAVLALIVLLASPMSAFGQELLPDVETLAKARVLQVTEERTEILPGTETPHTVQTLRALVLEGVEEGETITFENDFAQLDTGDVFYLRHLVSPLDGSESYSVADPYRLPVLMALAAAFLLLLVLFGGIQGMRGLFALGLSLVLIFYLLLPGILKGYSPVLVSVGVSSLIIIAGSYITHGLNRTTTAAVLGMIATVIVTGLAAWYVVDAAMLSGYNSEESTYLNFHYRGTLDLAGILLSSIIIGLLGVLYDIAIGQAIAVEELVHSGNLTKKKAFERAIRIGREHIGALVNTLAIAYVGASLPLLLLLDSANAPLGYIVNGEVLSTEIIRILIGSCGLILAVPVTTLIAIVMLSSHPPPARKGSEHRHIHQ